MKSALNLIILEAAFSNSVDQFDICFVPFVYEFGP